MANDIFFKQFLQEKQDDNRLDKILLLQRLIRSFYVRRQFEEVRKEYLKTLSDIEGDILIKPIEILPTKPDHQRTIVILPTKDELLKKREEIAIELLWIEQAIQSRKDYLRVKSRYTTPVS